MFRASLPFLTLPTQKYVVCSDSASPHNTCSTLLVVNANNSSELIKTTCLSVTHLNNGFDMHLHKEEVFKVTSVQSTETPVLVDPLELTQRR